MGLCYLNWALFLEDVCSGGGRAASASSPSEAASQLRFVSLFKRVLQRHFHSFVKLLQCSPCISGCNSNSSKSSKSNSVSSSNSSSSSRLHSSRSSTSSSSSSSNSSSSSSRSSSSSNRSRDSSRRRNPRCPVLRQVSQGLTMWSEANVCMQGGMDSCFRREFRTSTIYNCIYIYIWI